MDERYPLVFDPQTSGGLLASLARRTGLATALKNFMTSAMCTPAIVGRVSPASNLLEPITLVSRAN